MNFASLLFSFHGRIGLSEYWFALAFLAVPTGILAFNPDLIPLYGPLLIWPVLAVQSKRCIDCSWSPWLGACLTLLLNVVWLVALGFIPSSRISSRRAGMRRRKLAGVPPKEGLEPVSAPPPSRRQRRTFATAATPSDQEASGDSANSPDLESTRILSCPSCRQSIRVPFPPPSTAARCTLCQTRFHLFVDRFGNLAVYVSPEDRDTSHLHGQAPLDEITIRHALAVLEVGAKATREEVRTAYRRKIRQYHPDKVAQMGAEVRELAERKTKDINLAYKRLKEAGIAA